MVAYGEPTAHESFGPAVIFGALVEEDVFFYIVGFITHYACELYHQQRPMSLVDESRRPRSHAENRNRLARALRKLGAAVHAEDGALDSFTGDGSGLTTGQHLFHTRHGDIHILVSAPAAGQTTPGLDAFSGGVRIGINVPIPRLRAYLETGKFAGLAELLEIVELFDKFRAGGDT